MVRDCWKFTAPPFEATLSPAAFCCGQPQDEVLARLEWLFEERQRFALVIGAAGVGKSHLATMAVRRLGALGAEAVGFKRGSLGPHILRIETAAIAMAAAYRLT